MRMFLYGIALMLGFVATAWAQGCGIVKPGRHCDFSFDAGKYHSDEAAKFGAGSVEDVCMLDGKQVSDWFATPVSRGDSGVCFYWMRDMDEKVAPAEFPHRTLLMQTAQGPCPRQDDAGYIYNDRVPDGVFAALMTLWRESGTAPGKGFVFPPLTARDAKFGVPDFAALLRTPEGRRRITLTGIEADPVVADVAGPAPRGAGSFRMAIGDADQPKMLLGLLVDWSKGEFRVTGIDAMLLGC